MRRAYQRVLVWGVVRTWVLIIAASAGCKTATEKQCDGMLERYQACSGTAFTATMQSAATAKCYVALGHELRAGDTTSFAAIEHAALDECQAIEDCGALKACFEKHECRWVLASPGAEPFFACGR
jgi:hypothetical protein